jgi:hypothetical protein
MSTFKIKQLGLSFPIKNVTTNPHEGEIMGEIGNLASWPKEYKLRVFVQNNELTVRGIVFVVTTNYAQIDLGSGLSGFADPFIRLLMERPDIFVEMQ